MRTRTLLAVLLVAATAAVYLQVRRHAFVNFDDRVYILHNPMHRQGLGLDSLAAAFRVYDTNWIPLTWISLQIDHALYGEEPAGYLLTNVALHAASAVLLFLTLARMTGAPGPSAFAAGVFAVHPLHVESVAWASERKDALSGLFWMLAMLAYARYAERPSAGRYLAVAGSLALGLLAKPTLVTLPLALLLLDYWPLQRLAGRGALAEAVREKLPLFALALAASAVTFAVQRATGQMAHGDALPLELRVMNACESYVWYLAKSFWPSGLAAYYPHPLDALSPARAAAAALLLAAFTAVALRARRARPYLLMGWLWFLVTLLPMIGLVQVSLQARADRYMYVPLVGLGCALAWGAADWARGAPGRRRALALLAGAALAALGAAAHRQVGTWRDTLTLFERARAVTRDNYFAHNGIAGALLERGRTAEAEAHYREAVRLEPRWALPYLGLADALAAQGALEQALAQVRAALEIEPDRAGARAQLGVLLVRSRRYEEAHVELLRARELGADSAELHAALGTTFARRGRPREAARHYREALRRRPGWSAVAAALASLPAPLADPGGAPSDREVAP